MNEKEIGELRRRIRPDKTSITHVRGCYVNENREMISQFDQSLGMMTQEKMEKILALLRKTLSGTLGKSLIDLEFDTKQVVEGEEHKLLMALRGSELKDEEAIQALFQKCVSALELPGNYLILLAYDTYDVPYRSKDGLRQDDAGSEVFKYILCAVCPVKPTKPALSYHLQDNQFHEIPIDDLVAPPEVGFLFPAFDERTTNLYNTLYYTRNPKVSQEAFVDSVFHVPMPMPADSQKETFQTVLEEALGDECSMEVVQSVHDQFYSMIQEHKENHEPEPLTISRDTVQQVLDGCGVSEDHAQSFAERFDTAFGEHTALTPGNLMNPKRMEIRTSNVVIYVNSDRTDLVKTEVIDGCKYIMIRVEDEVEVNGVNVHI